MNILQITKYFYPAISFGGPVQCTYNLSKYLVKRGHKVTVYTTDALDISTNARIKEKHQEIDGVDVFYFRNLAKFHGLFVSPGIIHTLRKTIGNFDVVHLHEYRTFQNLAFQLLNNKRVPYVLSCHGEFTYNQESWDNFLLRRLFEYAFGKKLVDRASRLLALTQFEAAQYFDAGIDQNKIVVVPNGVAPEEFSDASQAGSLRKAYGIAEEEIVLYLGRIARGKGIDTLVKAFALLAKSRSDVKLVLAGPDDGFVSPLRKLVASLNLEGKVLFTGCLNRRQVLAAYNDATFVVYPSIQEGFGLVPLEAGIMGRPVIVSDAPAMDFVKRGRFGLTVKYGSVSQLNEAMQTILNGPEKAREFGRNGQRFVTDNYSWEAVGKRIEDVYYNVSGCFSDSFSRAKIG